MRKNLLFSIISLLLIGSLLVDPHLAQAVSSPARSSVPLSAVPFEQCALNEKAFFFSAFDLIFGRTWRRIRSSVPAEEAKLLRSKSHSVSSGGVRFLTPPSRVERFAELWQTRLAPFTPWAVAVYCSFLLVSHFAGGHSWAAAAQGVALPDKAGFLVLIPLVFSRHTGAPATVLSEDESAPPYEALSARLRREVQALQESLGQPHADLSIDQTIARDGQVEDLWSGMLERFLGQYAETEDFPEIFLMELPEPQEFFAEGDGYSPVHIDGRRAYFSLPLLRAIKDSSAEFGLDPDAARRKLEDYAFARLEGKSHAEIVAANENDDTSNLVDAFLRVRLDLQLKEEKAQADALKEDISVSDREKILKLTEDVALVPRYTGAWVGCEEVKRKIGKSRRAKSRQTPEQRARTGESDPLNWFPWLEAKVLELTNEGAAEPKSFDEAIKEWTFEYSFFPHVTGYTAYGHPISEGYHLVRRRPGKRGQRITLGPDVIGRKDFAPLPRVRVDEATGVARDRWQEAIDAYEQPIRASNEKRPELRRLLLLLRDVDTMEKLLHEGGLSDADLTQLRGFARVAVADQWFSKIDVFACEVKVGSEIRVLLSEAALERIMQTADRLLEKGKLNPTAQRRLLSPAQRLRGPIGAASERAREGEKGDPRLWNLWAQAYTEIVEQFASFPIKFFGVGRNLYWANKQDLPYTLKANQIKTVVAAGSGPMILLRVFEKLWDFLVKLGVIPNEIRVYSVDFAHQMLVHGARAAPFVRIRSQPVTANITDSLPFASGSVDFMETGIMGTLGDDVNREKVSKKMHYFLEANRIVHAPDFDSCDFEPGEIDGRAIQERLTGSGTLSTLIRERLQAGQPLLEIMNALLIDRELYFHFGYGTFGLPEDIRRLLQKEREGENDGSVLNDLEVRKLNKALLYVAFPTGIRKRREYFELADTHGRGGLLMITVKNKPIPDDFQKMLAEFGFEVVSERRPRLTLLTSLLAKLAKGEFAREKIAHIKTQLSGASYLYAVKTRTLTQKEMARLRTRTDSTDQADAEALADIARIRKGMEYDDSLKEQEKKHPHPGTRHWTQRGIGTKVKELNWNDVDPDEIVAPTLTRAQALSDYPDFLPSLDRLDAIRTYRPDLLGPDHEAMFDEIKAEWDNPESNEFYVEDIRWVMERVKGGRGYRNGHRKRKEGTTTVDTPDGPGPDEGPVEPPEAPTGPAAPKVRSRKSLEIYADELNARYNYALFQRSQNEQERKKQAGILAAIAAAHFMASPEEALEQLASLFPGASLFVFTTEVLEDWFTRGESHRSRPDLLALFEEAGLPLTVELEAAVCAVFGVKPRDLKREEEEARSAAAAAAAEAARLAEEQAYAQKREAAAVAIKAVGQGPRGWAAKVSISAIVDVLKKTADGKSSLDEWATRINKGLQSKLSFAVPKNELMRILREKGLWKSPAEKPRSWETAALDFLRKVSTKGQLEKADWDAVKATVEPLVEPFPRELTEAAVRAMDPALNDAERLNRAEDFLQVFNTAYLNRHQLFYYFQFASQASKRDPLPFGADNQMLPVGDPIETCSIDRVNEKISVLPLQPSFSSHQDEIFVVTGVGLVEGSTLGRTSAAIIQKRTQGAMAFVRMKGAGWQADTLKSWYERAFKISPEAALPPSGTLLTIRQQQLFWLAARSLGKELYRRAQPQEKRQFEEMSTWLGEAAVAFAEAYLRESSSLQAFTKKLIESGEDPARHRTIVGQELMDLFVFLNALSEAERPSQLLLEYFQEVPRRQNGGEASLHERILGGLMLQRGAADLLPPGTTMDQAVLADNDTLMRLAQRLLGHSDDDLRTMGRQLLQDHFKIQLNLKAGRIAVQDVAEPHEDRREAPQVLAMLAGLESWIPTESLVRFAEELSRCWTAGEMPATPQALIDILVAAGVGRTPGLEAAVLRVLGLTVEAEAAAFAIWSPEVKALLTESFEKKALQREAWQKARAALIEAYGEKSITRELDDAATAALSQPSPVAAHFYLDLFLEALNVQLLNKQSYFLNLTYAPGAAGQGPVDVNLLPLGPVLERYRVDRVNATLSVYEATPGPATEPAWKWVTLPQVGAVRHPQGGIKSAENYREAVRLMSEGEPGVLRAGRLLKQWMEKAYGTDATDHDLQEGIRPMESRVRLSAVIAMMMGQKSYREAPPDRKRIWEASGKEPAFQAFFQTVVRQDSPMHQSEPNDVLEAFAFLAELSQSARPSVSLYDFLSDALSAVLLVKRPLSDAELHVLSALAERTDSDLLTGQKPGETHQEVVETLLIPLFERLVTAPEGHLTEIAQLALRDHFKVGLEFKEGRIDVVNLPEPETPRQMKINEAAAEILELIHTEAIFNRRYKDVKLTDVIEILNKYSQAGAVVAQIQKKFGITLSTDKVRKILEKYFSEQRGPGGVGEGNQPAWAGPATALLLASLMKERLDKDLWQKARGALWAGIGPLPNGDLDALAQEAIDEADRLTGPARRQALLRFVQQLNRQWLEAGQYQAGVWLNPSGGTTALTVRIMRIDPKSEEIPVHILGEPILRIYQTKEGASLPELGEASRVVSAPGFVQSKEQVRQRILRLAQIHMNVMALKEDSRESSRHRRMRQGLFEWIDSMRGSLTVEQMTQTLLEADKERRIALELVELAGKEAYEHLDSSRQSVIDVSMSQYGGYSVPFNLDNVRPDSPLRNLLNNALPGQQISEAIEPVAAGAAEAFSILSALRSASRPTYVLGEIFERPFSLVVGQHRPLTRGQEIALELIGRVALPELVKDDRFELNETHLLTLSEMLQPNESQLKALAEEVLEQNFKTAPARAADGSRVMENLVPSVPVRLGPYRAIRFVKEVTRYFEKGQIEFPAWLGLWSEVQPTFGEMPTAVEEKARAASDISGLPESERYARLYAFVEALNDFLITKRSLLQVSGGHRAKDDWKVTLLEIDPSASETYKVVGVDSSPIEVHDFTRSLAGESQARGFRLASRHQALSRSRVADSTREIVQSAPGAAPGSRARQWFDKKYSAALNLEQFIDNDYRQLKDNLLCLTGLTLLGRKAKAEATEDQWKAWEAAQSGKNVSTYIPFSESFQNPGGPLTRDLKALNPQLALTGTPADQSFNIAEAVSNAFSLISTLTFSPRPSGRLADVFGPFLISLSRSKGAVRGLGLHDAITLFLLAQALDPKSAPRLEDFYDGEKIQRLMERLSDQFVRMEDSEIQDLAQKALEQNFLARVHVKGAELVIEDLRPEHKTDWQGTGGRSGNRTVGEVFQMIKEAVGETFAPFVELEFIVIALGAAAGGHLEETLAKLPEPLLPVRDIIAGILTAESLTNMAGVQRYGAAPNSEWADPLKKLMRESRAAGHLMNDWTTLSGILVKQLGFIPPEVDQAANRALEPSGLNAPERALRFDEFVASLNRFYLVPRYHYFAALIPSGETMLERVDESARDYTVDRVGSPLAVYSITRIPSESEQLWTYEVPGAGMATHKPFATRLANKLVDSVAAIQQNEPSQAKGSGLLLGRWLAKAFGSPLKADQIVPALESRTNFESLTSMTARLLGRQAYRQAPLEAKPRLEASVSPGEVEIRAFILNHFRDQSALRQAYEIMSSQSGADPKTLDTTTRIMLETFIFFNTLATVEKPSQVLALILTDALKEFQASNMRNLVDAMRLTPLMFTAIPELRAKVTTREHLLTLFTPENVMRLANHLEHCSEAQLHDLAEQALQEHFNIRIHVEGDRIEVKDLPAPDHPGVSAERQDALKQLSAWLEASFAAGKPDADALAGIWSKLASPADVPAMLNFVRQMETDSAGTTSRQQLSDLYSLVRTMNWNLGPQGTVLQVYFDDELKQWRASRLTTEAGSREIYKIDELAIAAYTFLDIPKGTPAALPNEQIGVGWHRMRRTAELVQLAAQEAAREKSKESKAAVTQKMASASPGIEELAAQMERQKRLSQLAIAVAAKTVQELFLEAKGEEKALFERETPATEVTPWVAFAEKMVRPDSVVKSIYQLLTERAFEHHREPKFNIAEGIVAAFGSLKSMTLLSNPLVALRTTISPGGTGKELSIDSILILGAFAKQLGMNIEIVDINARQDDILDRLAVMTPAQLNVLAEEALNSNFHLQVDMTDIRKIKTHRLSEDGPIPLRTNLREELLKQFASLFQHGRLDKKSYGQIVQQLERQLGPLPASLREPPKDLFEWNGEITEARYLGMQRFVKEWQTSYLDQYGYWLVVDFGGMLPLNWTAQLIPLRRSKTVTTQVRGARSFQSVQVADQDPKGELHVNSINPWGVLVNPVTTQAVAANHLELVRQMELQISAALGMPLRQVRFDAARAIIDLRRKAYPADVSEPRAGELLAETMLPKSAAFMAAMRMAEVDHEVLKATVTGAENQIPPFAMNYPAAFASRHVRPGSLVDVIRRAEEPWHIFGEKNPMFAQWRDHTIASQIAQVYGMLATLSRPDQPKGQTYRDLFTILLPYLRETVTGEKNDVVDILSGMFLTLMAQKLPGLEKTTFEEVLLPDDESPLFSKISQALMAMEEQDINRLADQILRENFNVVLRIRSPQEIDAENLVSDDYQKILDQIMARLPGVASSIVLEQLTESFIMGWLSGKEERSPESIQTKLRAAGIAAGGDIESIALSIFGFGSTEPSAPKDPLETKRQEAAIKIADVAAKRQTGKTRTPINVARIVEILEELTEPGVIANRVNQAFKTSVTKVEIAKILKDTGLKNGARAQLSSREVALNELTDWLRAGFAGQKLDPADFKRVWSQIVAKESFYSQAASHLAETFAAQTGETDRGRYRLMYSVIYMINQALGPQGSLLRADRATEGWKIVRLSVVPGKQEAYRLNDSEINVYRFERIPENLTANLSSDQYGIGVEPNAIQVRAESLAGKTREPKPAAGNADAAETLWSQAVFGRSASPATVAKALEENQILSQLAWMAAGAASSEIYALSSGEERESYERETPEEQQTVMVPFGEKLIRPRSYADQIYRVMRPESRPDAQWRNQAAASLMIVFGDLAAMAYAQNPLFALNRLMAPSKEVIVRYAINATTGLIADYLKNRTGDHATEDIWTQLLTMSPQDLRIMAQEILNANFLLQVDMSNPRRVTTSRIAPEAPIPLRPAQAVQLKNLLQNSLKRGAIDPQEYAKVVGDLSRALGGLSPELREVPVKLQAPEPGGSSHDRYNQLHQWFSDLDRDYLRAKGYRLLWDLSEEVTVAKKWDIALVPLDHRKARTIRVKNKELPDFTYDEILPTQADDISKVLVPNRVGVTLDQAGLFDMAKHLPDFGQSGELDKHPVGQVIMQWYRASFPVRMTETEMISTLPQHELMKGFALHVAHMLGLQAQPGLREIHPEIGGVLTRGSDSQAVPFVEAHIVKDSVVDRIYHNEEGMTGTRLDDIEKIGKDPRQVYADPITQAFAELTVMSQFDPPARMLFWPIMQHLSRYAQAGESKEIFPMRESLTLYLLASKIKEAPKVRIIDLVAKDTSAPSILALSDVLLKLDPKEIQRIARELMEENFDISLILGEDEVEIVRRSERTAPASGGKPAGQGGGLGNGKTLPILAAIGTGVLTALLSQLHHAPAAGQQLAGFQDPLHIFLTLSIFLPWATSLFTQKLPRPAFLRRAA